MKPKSNKPKVIPRFDEDRAVQLFTILQNLWDNKEHVFNGIVLPQDRWPIPDDPVQAANYFAYAAITQRGGVVSEDPFKWVNHLREKHPDLFDPFAVASRWTPQRIEDVIKLAVIERRSWAPGPEQVTFFKLTQKKKKKRRGKNKELYKLDEFAASWFENSVTLAERWNGNTLNIFDGVEEFEEAFARIDHKNKVNKGLRAFIGIRRKIFSLLTIWLQEKGFIPVFPTPIPVDFHAQRLLFGTHVVEPDGLQPFQGKKIHPPDFNGRNIVRVTERITDIIALWSQPFMVKHGFSHLSINPALWVLSRELCPRELQTKGTGRGRKESRRSRKKIKLLYPEVLEARPDKWPSGYVDVARACPLSHLCSMAIPSSPFYAFGMLLLLRRIAYPHPMIPHVFAMSVPPPNRKNNRK